MGRRRQLRRDRRALQSLVSQALSEGATAGERRAFEKTLRATAREVLDAEISDAASLVEQEGIDDALRVIRQASEETWPDRWREKMGPVITAVASASTEEAGELLGLSFTVKNPKMAEWLDGYVSELAEGLPKTSYEKVRNSIESSIADGLGVRDAAARLREEVGDLAKSRADLIARTETHRATVGAGLLQAEESGVVKAKRWMTAGDSRVRLEHQALDGVEMEMDKPFPNGEMYPRSPNCRCVLEYVLNEEMYKPLPDEPERDYRQFANEPEIRDWSQSEFNDWLDGLSPDERQDLLDYQNGPHAELNNWLRFGDVASDEALPILESWRDNLDSAISKGAAPEDLKVYRALERQDLSDNFDSLVGASISDPGYSSTSLSEPAATRFSRGYEDPIIVEYRVPKGTNMAYVDKVNSVDEYEAILPRDIQANVLEVGYDDRGRKRIVAEILSG